MFVLTHIALSGNTSANMATVKMIKAHRRERAVIQATSTERPYALLVATVGMVDARMSPEY